jgi:NET1-associated nuclear protein 1 (U3 small nucleolar RNA-associated protein 17)
MADLSGTPKLKRKREDGEAQRKKARTQRKSQAQAGHIEETTPVKPTPTAAPETASSTNGDKSTPQKPLVNGSLTPVIDTPSTTLERKNKKNRKKSQNEEAEGVANAEKDAEEQRGDANKQSRRQRKQKEKKKSADLWAISEAHGGWFLPQDPIFSLDEKYLLLPKLKALEVYTTETSLLARELPVGGSGVILAAALSSTQSSRVYIADSTGIITLWDWTNGSKVGRWDISANVRQLAVVTQPDLNQDLLFTHDPSNSHAITVHALRTKQDLLDTESKRIVKAHKPITGIQVFLQGKIVVLSTANRILIGKRMKLQKTALQDFEYTWREFDMSKRITTFSAYVRTTQADQSKGQQATHDLDLAVGDEDGVIFLFENIFSSLAAVERSQKDKSGNTLGPESLRPKRLHWHRAAVGSVKWSLDGRGHTCISIITS